MPISTVIREKRKELGLTQEQVADRLGVTPPAVNKWEKGISCPDISILAPLARLLETDVNTLLCFQEEMSDEEIARLCNELAERAQEENGVEKAFELCGRKVREYPRCPKLIHTMATMMQGILLMSGCTERDRYEEQIRRWYEQVLGCKGNEKEKNAAAYMLVSWHIRRKEYEKAQQMLDLLPEQDVDKRILQAKLFMEQEKTDEAALLIERKLVNALNEIQGILNLLLSIAFQEGAPERAEQIAEVGRQTAVLYDLWGYSPLILPMELALKKKDRKESIACIRQMLEMALEPQHMTDSPLYTHIYSQKLGKKSVDDGMEEYGRKVIPVLLKELKTGESYEFLRDEAEFQKLIQDWEKKIL